MFDPVVTPLIFLAAAGTATSAYQSAKSGRAQERAAKTAEDRARKQEQEAKDLAEKEKRNRLQAVMRNQARRRAGSTTGLRSTVLTGPLGLPGGGTPSGQKTLLGQ